VTIREIGVSSIASALTLAAVHTAAGDPVPRLEQPHYSYTNRLIREKSPYLLQHAHNPVDWYPWGNEAFARARDENKPIFLSVGYSTCHWCHVMERESFENVEIANLLNTGFVCIKVDREERPDVDQVYMTFVQATTGSGGWPMSVWLTPDLKPFLGGTYFDPEKFKELLNRVSETWEKEHDKIIASGESITRKLQQYAEPGGHSNVQLNPSLLDTCYSELKASFDSRYGGFGDAPKFPRVAGLNFLLRYYDRTGKKDALEMTLRTLRKMGEGGIHDQLGGGFHRYSTDAEWRTPHFEKMLYDQAQLACSYLDAYQITHEKLFAQTARDILEYVQRDMTGEQGQFYSAEDADSPVPGAPTTNAEGAFYVWEQKQIEDALGKSQAALFDYYHGVEPKGNVRSDSHGDLSGKNILIVAHSLEETSKHFKISEEEVRSQLDSSRQRLFQARAHRPRPRLDDKTITAWNGLMISAFARASQVLGDPSLLMSAEKARSFLKKKCYAVGTGKLLRRFRAGDSAIEGYADDYAFLIQGLLDLYETSFEIDDLNWAITLQNTQSSLFEDKNHGAFFTTAESDPSLLLRMKEDYDGAEPSANSVTVLNLLRLAQMTDNKARQQSADASLKAFADRLHKEPGAMPQMLVALDFSLGKPKQIVIAGKRDAEDTKAMLRAAHEGYHPNNILLLADGAEGQRALESYLEFLRDLQPVEGKATGFVCENYTCHLPTTNLNEFRKQVSETKPR
jgi:uncharacterized protein YyaL (SSP411 family)